jgi:DNA-binding PucR family transcriptional regulator
VYHTITGWGYARKQESSMLRTQKLDVETLHRELQRKDRELTLSADIGAMISRALPLRTVLDAIAARVAELLSTPCCAILLLTLDGRQITIEGAAGLTDDYIAMVNCYGITTNDGTDLPSVSVCRSGQPMIWADLSCDPALTHLHEAQRRQGLRSMIAVPLFGPRGVIGTLNCYHTRPHHFGADDQHVLTTIGNHAAVAITNARLIDQLNASVRRLSEMNEVIQHQHAILRRSDDIHRQLTTLVLEEPGLDAVIDTLAQLLRCGVSLYDPFLRLLTSAPPPDAADPPVVHLDPHMLADCAFQHGRRAVVHLPAGPFVSAAAAVYPIVARDQTFGYLVAPKAVVVSGEIEQRALEHAAVVCGRELMHQRLVQEVERRQVGALLDALLAGQPRSAAEMQRQAEYLGLHQERNVRLMLIALDQGANATLDGAAQLPALITTVLREHCPRALVVPRGAATLALLVGASACSPAKVCAALQSTCAEMLAGSTISIALSGLAERPEDLARAYAEVQEALTVLQQLDVRNRVLSTDELGVCGLILRSTARAELLRMAAHRLAPLQAYSTRRNIDLLGTLETYLQAGCRPQRTADALFLHVNTVKHRLALIQELTSADLADTRILLEFQLALLTRRLIGDAGSIG